MKKRLINSLLIVGVAILMTSCYTYTFSVGDGAQTGVEVTAKKHYVIYGLAPVSISDPVEMAGGADNFDVKIEHTFVDGLLNAITFGIYTPTTTTVWR